MNHTLSLPPQRTRIISEPVSVGFLRRLFGFLARGSNAMDALSPTNQDETVLPEHIRMIRGCSSTSVEKWTAAGIPNAYEQLRLPKVLSTGFESKKDIYKRSISASY